MSIKDLVRRDQQSGNNSVQLKFRSLKPFTYRILCHACSLVARWLSHSFSYLWLPTEKGLHPVLSRVVVFEDSLRSPSIENGLHHVLEVILGPTKTLSGFLN